MKWHNFTDLKNVSGIQTFVASVIVRYLILSAQARTTFIISFLDSRRRVVICKGTLRQAFIIVYTVDWWYSQSCWYFPPSFVNCCPCSLLSGSVYPPPPLPCVKVQYIKTGCCWEGVGGVYCLVLLATIFYRSLSLCIWPDWGPTKLLNHPKQKN